MSLMRSMVVSLAVKIRNPHLRLTDQEHSHPGA